MIISNIDDIAIHSSLEDKIDMECLNAKHTHHGVINLTQTDIETIRPVSKIKSFYDIGYNTMRVTSTTKEPLKRCVFFNRDNKCELEQLNAQPAACKAFPIILDRGILRLSASCKTGSTPAYILLKDKIIQLTSPEFYKKLERMMAQPDEKLFLLA